MNKLIQNENDAKSGLRELSMTELEQVSGGILPVLGAVVAAIGHFTARTVLTSFTGRIGLGLTVYQLAVYTKRR
ncbi:MAG: class IIb bacteriocin, lactobin A/cerein 7B family [Pseudomonadales bacterium]|nr:class IIb bacteriocin, lactobin A/cerein 7B family [Pseudomonadales bacterium]